MIATHVTTWKFVIGDDGQFRLRVLSSFDSPSPFLISSHRCSSGEERLEFSQYRIAHEVIILWDHLDFLLSRKSVHSGTWCMHCKQSLPCLNTSAAWLLSRPSDSYRLLAPRVIAWNRCLLLSDISGENACTQALTLPTSLTIWIKLLALHCTDVRVSFEYTIGIRLCG